MESEAELLRDFLDQQRNHVLGILEGLTGEQLRRPVLPSGWNCLGMVKHLAMAEWQLGPGESADDVFALYRDEIERSNAVIAATALDAPPPATGSPVAGMGDRLSGPAVHHAPRDEGNRVSRRAPGRGPGAYRWPPVDPHVMTR